jgi:hypothetical protein
VADFIIDDSNYQLVSYGYRRGLTTRTEFNYMTSNPYSTDITLIPRDEWGERIADKDNYRRRLSDLRHWSSLDQNGQGFCWAYSTTSCVMYLRAYSGMPHVRLSAHGVACKIYNHQDRGAWGAKSMDFVSKNGVPPTSHWAEQSMSRTYDTPETWKEAKKYQVTEGWLDINVSHPADAELSFDQVMSLLLCNVPVVLDYDWWGHSVMGADAVDLNPGGSVSDVNRWGIRIQNSWGDGWGENGFGVLKGRKAVPVGACAPRALVGG